jgi:RHS repeat-associated protein
MARMLVQDLCAIGWVNTMRAGIEQEKRQQQTSINIYFYHCDHLGTPIALTDRQGQIVWGAVKRDPWGNIEKEFNPRNIHQDIRLPGQYHDRETDLYYNRYRYYDSKIGGYVNQDSIRWEGGRNFYSYPSNPMELMDPYGLQNMYPAPAIDPITKQPIGKFIADSRGNVVMEPVGGKTGAYPPSNPSSVDTHTYYPNGSNAYRLNPSGHAGDPTPHAHAHLPGSGPGKKGQGPSLDAKGTVVSPKSLAAHIPLKTFAVIDALRGILDIFSLDSCENGSFGQCFCALTNRQMGYDKETSDNACHPNSQIY